MVSHKAKAKVIERKNTIYVNDLCIEDQFILILKKES